MKTITLIPNPTAPNLESLAAEIVLACGGVATSRLLTFDCPDKTADECIAAGVAKLAEAVPDYKAERAWLAAYKGTFEFYVSLRTQLARKGDLSEKQWASVTKAVAKDAAPSVARDYSLKPGTRIVVGKFIGEEIAAKAGCSRPHYGMEVLAVLAETPKAYHVQLRLAAVRSTRCCVCGLTLKNPVSVSLGIGPICGNHWGVGQEPDQLEALAVKLRSFATVTTWLPKSQIKERLER